MNLIGGASKKVIAKGVDQTIPVQIIRHEVIAPNVITLSLAQPGTGLAPGPYLPGQFITLVIPGNTGNIYRSYSLCGSGNPREPWEITLKRVPGGVISNYLHDSIRAGMILHVTPPHGTFVLPASLRPEQTLIFVAVGSGITPIRGFLRTLAALPPGRRPKVQLHYASRSLQEMIYRDEIFRLDWVRQMHYLRTDGRRMTPNQILANAHPLPSNAHWYICGPETLNVQLNQALVSRGVPERLIHFEIFADQSRRPLASASQAVVGRIAINDTRVIVDVRGQETVLQALERHGYQPEFSCRAGACGTCQLHVLQGKVRNPGTRFLTAAELKSGTVLGCIARPQGDIMIESGGIPPRGTPVIKSKVTRKRTAQKYRLRLAAALTIGLMTLGLWQLTDYKASASTSGSTTSAATPTPTATSTSSTSEGTPGVQATSTPTPTPTPMPTVSTKTASS